MYNMNQYDGIWKMYIKWSVIDNRLASATRQDPAVSRLI